MSVILETDELNMCIITILDFFQLCMQSFYACIVPKTYHRLNYLTISVVEGNS